METRPLKPADVDLLRDIDATVEATRYLHVVQAGEGLGVSWRVEERALAERRVDGNPLAEDSLFLARQVAGGIEEGLGLVTEYDGQLVALLLAQPDLSRNVLRLVDLRVDFDFRRQGMGTALGYMLSQHARDRGLRAVLAETPSDNLAAARFLSRGGYQLAGVDTRRNSNHDLVKERATLVWYLPTD